MVVGILNYKDKYNINLRFFLEKSSFIKKEFNSKMYSGKIKRNYNISYDLYFLYWWFDKTLDRHMYYKNKFNTKDFSRKSQNYYCALIEETSEGLKHIETLIDEELKKPKK